MSELPLIQAAKNGYLKKTITLIQAGNSVCLCDEINATALYWSACRGHQQICEVLIQAGSNLNAQVTWGSTPLHAACDRGHADCAKLLIQCGAAVNIQNSRGDTPLHVSAYRGFIRIVQLLIGAQANVFLKNDKNRMACEEADSNGHTNTANLLTQSMKAVNESSSERSNFYDSGISNGGQWIVDSQRSSITNGFPHQQINGSGKENLSVLHNNRLKSNADYVQYNTNMTGFRNDPYRNFEKRREPQENVDDYDECDGFKEKLNAYCKQNDSIQVANGNIQHGCQLSTVTKNANLHNGTGRFPDQTFKTYTPVSIQETFRHTSVEKPLTDYGKTNDVFPVQEHQLPLETSNGCTRNIELTDYEADIRQREAIERFAESLQMELVNQREHLEDVQKQNRKMENSCSDWKRLYEEVKHELCEKEIENTNLKIVYHNERQKKLEVELGIRGTQTVPKRLGLTSVSNSFTHKFLFKFLQDISLEGCSWTKNDRAMLRLKEMLYTQYLKQEFTPPLDTPDKEWILGKDYNIIGNKPINHISDKKRNGACSLVFRISHEAKHYILKMMINMINLHATKHGDGHSMQSYLEHNFSPEYDIPQQLSGHANVIRVQHHFSGSTENFAQYRRLIIPESIDVQIDMTSRTTFLVTEEFPSTLMDFMENQRILMIEPNFSFNVIFLLHLVYQLLSAVYYLQRNAVVHRDIKADNIFLDKKLRPVLGDFGFAKKLHGTDGKPLLFLNPQDAAAGNSHAWAPELARLNRIKTISTSDNMKNLDDVYSKTDAYAVSRMMYSWLRSSDSADDFPQSSVNQPDYEDSEIPELPSTLPLGLRCILQNLVRNNPIDRISARKAMLSTGMMLFAPSQGEVMSMTDATSYCQSRMLKLLTLDNKQRSSGPDGYRQLTMEESVEVVSPELEADFLYNITPEEFWEIYQSMAQRHLLSI